jgi:hypothetical protein
MQMQIVNGKEREVVEMLRGYDLNGYEAKASRGAMPDYKRLMAQGLSKKYQKQFFKDLGDAFELNQSYLSPIVYTVFESLGRLVHRLDKGVDPPRSRQLYRGIDKRALNSFEIRQLGPVFHLQNRHMTSRRKFLNGQSDFSSI